MQARQRAKGGARAGNSGEVEVVMEQGARHHMAEWSAQQVQKVEAKLIQKAREHGAILSFEKPKKLRPTTEHAEEYQSDTNIAGTYVPNMSEADKLKWKAKRVKSGDDPRVEIRKTLSGAAGLYAQVLLVVRKDSVVMSANGKMGFSNLDWMNLLEAVAEAHVALHEKEAV